MKTFKIHNFGCRTNKYESEVYAGQLHALGLVAEEDESLADIHIINSCYVTKEAEKQAHSKVKELLRKNKKIYVTGCASGIFKDEENLIVIPNNEKEGLVKKIFPLSEEPFEIKNFSQTRAFIKIQDGCNSFCSYCTIPLKRGRSRSRKILDILKEVRALAERGFKEIVLTGINVGDFEDGEKKLPELILEIEKIRGIERIRISSIHPHQVDKRLQDTIIKSEKVCPSMHISLQSGSNDILKKMNRMYKIEEFLDLVAVLKKKNNFTFTTDIIVGFPEETEEDFLGSVNVVNEVGFAKVHIFPYSKRPYTKAAFLPEVPPEIISERKKRLSAFAEKKAFELREKYLGKKLMVLLEEKQVGKYIFGHSDNFLPVKVINENFSRNDLLEVELFENCRDCLIGKKT